MEGGADINKAEDEDGCTPLYVASEYGHVEVARALVEGGADITKATNAGSTPLQIATDKKHSEIITCWSSPRRCDGLLPFSLPLAATVAVTIMMRSTARWKCDWCLGGERAFTYCAYQ